MSKILEDVKKVLDVPESEDHFDTALLMAINSSMFVLKQIGLGEDEVLEITDETKWDELQTDIVEIPLIKSYITMDVKMRFDPPANNPSVIQAIESQLNETIWRLNILREYRDK